MLHDLDLHGLAHARHISTKPEQRQFKPGEQKIVAKLAVFSNTASIWFSAKNRYCVEWGDGKRTTYKSGVVANHTYFFDDLPGPILPDGSKEVTLTITPLKGYSLTEIDFDPQPLAEEGVYLSTAYFRTIEGALPNLNRILLSVERTKLRHPQLKKYSIQM